MAQVEKIENEMKASIAPEICVEVLSPGNSKQEILEKMELYFAKEAQEFWLCDENGNMSFYNPGGQLKQSEMVKDFPDHIEI